MFAHRAARRPARGTGRADPRVCAGGGKSRTRVRERIIGGDDAFALLEQLATDEAGGPARRPRGRGLWCVESARSECAGPVRRRPVLFRDGHRGRGAARHEGCRRLARRRARRAAGRAARCASSACARAWGRLPRARVPRGGDRRRRGRDGCALAPSSRRSPAPPSDAVAPYPPWRRSRPDGRRRAADARGARGRAPLLAAPSRRRWSAAARRRACSRASSGRRRRRPTSRRRAPTQWSVSSGRAGRTVGVRAAVVPPARAGRRARGGGAADAFRSGQSFEDRDDATFNRLYPRGRASTSSRSPSTRRTRPRAAAGDAPARRAP